MTTSIASPAAAPTAAVAGPAAVIDTGRVAALIHQLLVELGEDPAREGLTGTPDRVAAWWKAFLSPDCAETATCFTESQLGGQLVIVGGMSVWSLCEHHMLPMNLQVTAGYVPDGEVVGLSKFGRIAQHFAGRLQVQERFTRQVAEYLNGVIGHENIAVAVVGVHLCMSMRGVRMEEARTTTVHSGGRFGTDPVLSQQFLTLTTGLWGGVVITTAGIDFSVIAPPAYLKNFVAQEPARVHHVAAQHVLSDESYRAFFAHEAERGAEIIIDNGLFDLGYALPAESLVEAALAVSAREIILPDVMRDGTATLKASEKAAREIRKLSGDAFRLCAVLHAADDDEWLRTYDAFVTSGWAGAIALPASRRPDPDEQLCRTRWLATAYLQDRGLVDDLLIYRLLGLGRTGHLELIEQREHEWISSVDGAAPVILGAMGIALLPEGPYEKPSTPRIEKLGPIPEDRFDLIRKNISVVRAAAGSTVTIAEEHR